MLWKYYCTQLIIWLSNCRKSTRNGQHHCPSRELTHITDNCSHVPQHGLMPLARNASNRPLLCSDDQKLLLELSNWLALASLWPTWVHTCGVNLAKNSPTFQPSLIADQVSLLPSLCAIIDEWVAFCQPLFRINQSLFKCSAAGTQLPVFCSSKLFCKCL